MKKISLHKSMVQASREKKSLSGAIKVAKLNTPGNNTFWSDVKTLCGLSKNDVDPKFIQENAVEKELNKFNKKGENKGARLVWSDWMIKKIVSRVAFADSENEK